MVENGIADGGMEKNQVDTAISENHSEVDLIYVIVSLKNSPDCKVDTACQNHIFKIMESKEHL